MTNHNEFKKLFRDIRIKKEAFRLFENSYKYKEKKNEFKYNGYDL